MLQRRFGGGQGHLLVLSRKVSRVTKAAVHPASMRRTTWGVERPGEGDVPIGADRLSHPHSPPLGLPPGTRPARPRGGPTIPARAACSARRTRSPRGAAPPPGG